MVNRFFKADSSEIISRLAILLLFAGIFFYLTVPISDPDFWWHLASGRWMSENGALMDQDHFNVSFQFQEPSFFKDFILRQYWLSQLIFYALYSLSGFTGIILFCASVYTLMFFVMYRLMRLSGANRLLAVVFVYIATVIIIYEFRYIGARPQMWSSLFTVLIIYFLEMLNERRKWTFFAIPLLMIVWSNMHGGYIFGDIIIIVYLAGSLLARTANKTVLVVTTAALLLSGLNPNGYNALLVSLPFAGPLLESLQVASQQHIEPLLDSITEMQSLFKHAKLSGIIQSVPFFIGLVVVSLASFLANIKNRKKIKIEHLILYVVVLVMGLRSIRFIVFFVTVASFLTVANLKLFFENASLPRLVASKKIHGAATIILVLAISVNHVTAGIATTGLVNNDPYSHTYEGAVTFMRENRLQGNVFNDFTAGGYLIWRLTPDIKVFIDGRVLNHSAFEVYRTAIDYPETIPEGMHAPFYELALSQYYINYVLLPGCDKTSGTLIKLAPVLLADPAWTLIYADDNVLLFKRNLSVYKTVQRQPAVPKERAYQQILSLARQAAQEGHARSMPNWMLSLAVAYEGLGEKAEASRWLDEYQRLVSEDPYAAALKRKIGNSVQ